MQLQQKVDRFGRSDQKTAMNRDLIRQDKVPMR